MVRLLLLLTLFCSPWAIAGRYWPRRPVYAISSDGRYELLFLPKEQEFRLTRLGSPLPPQDGTLFTLNYSIRDLRPDDEVLASGVCPPAEWACCLPAGRGFVLALQGQPSWAFKRFAGDGAELWTLDFEAALAPHERCPSPHQDNLRLRDQWVDGDTLVVVFDGREQPGLVAFDVDTGARVPVPAHALARRIAAPDGIGLEDYMPAWAALTCPDPAAVDAAGETWFRVRSPKAQVAVAVLLAHHGDERARDFLREFVSQPVPREDYWTFIGREWDPRFRFQFERFLAYQYAVGLLPWAFEPEEAWRRLQAAEPHGHLGLALPYAYAQLGRQGLARAVTREALDLDAWAGHDPLCVPRGVDSAMWHRHDDAVHLGRLREVFPDVDPVSRATIAWSLCCYSGFEAQTVPFLLHALSDPDPEVRAVAAVALVEVDSALARNQVGALVAAQGAETPGVSKRAHDALDGLAKAFAADGTPAWAAVLQVYRVEALGLGAGTAVWFLLWALVPLPRPQRWGRRAIATLALASPPILVVSWAVLHSVEAPWTEPFLRRGLAEGGLSAPTLAVATLAGACGVLALAVVLGGRRRRA
ncbi:MAG: hypothetical protein R3F62_05070 [Planctomycetota bacterium]